MVKSQQDQIKQALAAANFYGQLLQVYPNDLKHRVNMRPVPFSNEESDDRSDRLLQLYVSQQNENLFFDNTSRQSSISSDMQGERPVSKTYSQHPALHQGIFL